MKHAKDQTTYYEQLRSLTLRNERKQAMREELSAYADFASVPETVRVGPDGRLSWYTQLQIAFITLKQNRMIKAGIMVAVLATTGGATSYAAHDAVPGDALYPVKLHVNENVRSSFTFGANAQTRYQGDLLMERITEVETLLDRDALTTEHAAEQSARVRAQAELLQERSVRADAAVRVAVMGDVATRLEVLQVRLTSRTDDAAQSLIIGLNQARTAAQSAGGQANIEVNQSTDAITDAEIRTAQLRQSLEAATDVSVGVRTELGAKLDAAAEATANVRADIDANINASVQGQIDSAVRLINEVEADIRTRGIDLNTTIQLRGEAGNESTGGTDAETESSLRLDSGVNINTDSLNVETTEQVEGNTGVRLGL